MNFSELIEHKNYLHEMTDN